MPLRFPTYFFFIFSKDCVDRYASLYYQSRPRALEALDSLPDLTHADQLKSKILFSVVVVSRLFTVFSIFNFLKIQEGLKKGTVLQL